jgi:Domain of unknown function (DUF4124)
MRQIAALLSMLVVLSAGAAEMWRWKDADGVMHYSDRPVPGAERIDVRSSQKSTGEFTPNAPEPVAPLETAATRYTRCAVASPVNDQVFNAVRTVAVSLAIEPGLSSDHQLQVILNGSPYTGWPKDALSHTLENMNRGSYTLSARVLDENGRALCTGPRYLAGGGAQSRAGRLP